MQKQRLAVKNLFLRAAMLTAFVFAQAAAPVIAATDVDLNPQRIAILRWHGANQSGPQVPVGTKPLQPSIRRGQHLGSKHRQQHP